MPGATTIRYAMSLHGRAFGRSFRVACGGGVLLLAMTSGTARAHAHTQRPNKHDERRQVETLEQQWVQAEIKGDVPALDRLLSDDFVGISMTGQVNTKVQQLDRMRRRDLVLTRLELDDMKIKLLGQVAVVTGRARAEGTSDGSPLKGNFRYTRVYLHQPSGAWKVTNFEVTRIPG